ncbi:MAG: hypothetical protein CMD92_02660 [Gammaproteobacteria bacterium]|nr:hypothetical protein [Gammaproteobacteria bacterium]HBW83424.1 hypothetical protein [Gammaproteobacteria bacterium]|tara:strand:+ start:9762 stop:10256 length:495 start_codon:yes stop_codon:yes gene_type:complete
MRNWAINLLAFIIVISLPACGFALRGSDSISSRFNSLNLELEQPGSELSALLKRSLTSAGVNLSPQQPNISATLRVSDEQLSSRPVSINPRARASQVEIRLSVRITLTTPGRTSTPEETLAVVRTYFQDIENIAGSQEEAQLIADELRRELSDQLLRRLESTIE